MPTNIYGTTGVDKFDAAILTGQTEDLTPDTANDFVLTYDTSAGTLKKVKMVNAAPAAFSTGTKLLFAEASAPTGWTQVTTHNDKLLRVVSGTGYGSGGTVAFSTFNAQTVVGNTTLTAAQSGVPAHTHAINLSYGGATGGATIGIIDNTSGLTNNASHVSAANSAASASSAHNHSLTHGIQYVDIIICQKS